MSAPPNDLRLRPLVRALRDDRVLAALQDVHKFNFDHPPKSLTDILEVDLGEFTKVAAENSFCVPSSDFVRRSMLMGWIKPIADQVVELLPHPACRTSRDIEAAVCGFMFCDPDFSRCYGLFVDAVLNQQVWRHPMEGTLFTPSSFVKQYSQDQRRKMAVATIPTLEHTASFVSWAECLASREYNHHPFESISVYVVCRKAGDAMAIAVEAESEEFSGDAAEECLAQICNMSQVVVRSFELMDGNLECFGREIVSVSESVAQLPSVLSVILESVWYSSESGKRKNQFSRIYNALRYLSVADKSSDVQVNLSLSIAAIECLVSDKKEKIADIVAKRISVLLRPAEDRSKAYKTIKWLYNLRSRFLHGDDPVGGTDYASRVCRAVAGSALIRSVLWVEFGDRVGRDTRSDIDFFAELDDANARGLRLSGLDSEDDRDWCPLLKGLGDSLGH